MIGRTAFRTVFLSLSIGTTGPLVANAQDKSTYISAGPSAIATIFSATCASGRKSAAGLRESFETYGFTADWHNDTYGYFTREGFAANYHIYEGSWNCFVSTDSAAEPDLCNAMSSDGIEVIARLPDGTCVAQKTELGLTILVRNICPDSSQGSCAWIQATLTSDRECHAAEDIDLSSLSRKSVITSY
ncbi:MAG: hypothetical protein AAF667_18530 [Pseudomonadota bacterium]